MEYFFSAAMVIAIAIAGAVAALMLIQRKGSDSGGEPGHDPHATDNEDTVAPGMAPDPTPLADTAEHAGESSEDGRTLSPPDAERHGGTGHPVGHYGATVPPEREREEAARLEREEGASTGRERETPGGHPVAGDRAPDSERLADRRP